MHKSIEEVTIGELMGEDHDVYLRKDKKHGFIFELDDENGELVTEENIHPFAAEGMAAFCRRYLHAYERVTKEETL